MYISIVLKFILNLFNSNFKIYISFFAITNDTVNSKFLSRFIARKFTQNYRFYELINPIRRELRTVSRYTSVSPKSYFHYRFKDSLDLTKTWSYRKDIYKSFLIYIFSIYKKNLYLYLKKHYTYFSLNMLNLFLWIKTSFRKQENLINFAYKFNLRRGAFAYFFSNLNLEIEKEKIFNRFFYPFKNAIINFSYKIDFSIFLDFIYEDLIINRNVIFINKIHITKHMYYFKYLQIFFNRYIQYKYWTYNISLLSSQYNFLKNRINKWYKGGLLGFKLQCSGRFSRKQRASSIWFSHGSVPLNTINELIDYSAFSIPIANSKITIKVWLHLSENYANWFYKVI